MNADATGKFSNVGEDYVQKAGSRATKSQPPSLSLWAEAHKVTILRNPGDPDGILGKYPGGLVEQDIPDLVTQQYNQLPDSIKNGAKNIQTVFLKILRKMLAAPYADKIKQRTTKSGELLLNVINERDYRIVYDDKRIEEKLNKEMEAVTAHQAAQQEKSFRRATESEKKKFSEYLIDSESPKALPAVGAANTKSKLRQKSEDAHLAATIRFKMGDQEYEAQLTGVFDGHGDKAKCSSFAANNIGEVLTKRLEEFGEKGLSDKAVWNALKLAMVDLSRMYEGKGGSTANVVLRIGKDLWIANTGDSRAFVINDKGLVKQLSEDAKLDEDKFLKSIEKRGGEVIKNRIVTVDEELKFRSLGTARAIGDHVFEGAVTARPKITKFTLPYDSSGHKLVQCCDGVFDVGSTNEVGSLVYSLRKKDYGNEEISREIVEAALVNKSGDDITAVVTSL